MQRKGWGMLAPTLLAGFAVNALSQSTQKSQDAFVSHPYTAKLTTTNVQTLANGVTMKHVFQKIEAVDSQGRRIMIMTSVATGRDPARTSYFLTDRQTKTSTQWAVPGKIITIREMPSGNGCWSSEDATVVSPQPSSESSEIAGGAEPAPVSMTERAPQTGLKEDSIREDLGTQVIQGLKATGARFTTTTPADYVGNDAPLVSTEERWVDKDYGLVVRDLRDNPQSSKSTTELTEFTSGEPDASLFQPPSGYQTQEVHVHKIQCGQR